MGPLTATLHITPECNADEGHPCDARCTECFGARSGRKVGTFKIAGDGSLERAPAVMKLAMGRTTKKPGPAKGKAVAVFVATPVWQTKVGA